MAEVVPIEDVDPPKRRSPAHILIDKMPDKYLTTRQVAEHFNVNVNTIRRLSKSRKPDGTNRVKAPSQAIVSGQMVIYAYSEADISELEDYFAGRLRNE